MGEPPETHWNYRVVQTQTKDGPMWGIYEVHYERGVPVARTINPITFVSDDGVDGIVWSLQHALADVERGVLTDDDIGSSYG